MFFLADLDAHHLTQASLVALTSAASPARDGRRGARLFSVLPRSSCSRMRCRARAQWTPRGLRRRRVQGRIAELVGQVVDRVERGGSGPGRRRAAAAMRGASSFSPADAGFFVVERLAEGIDRGRARGRVRRRRMHSYLRMRSESTLLGLQELDDRGHGRRHRRSTPAHGRRRRRWRCRNSSGSLSLAVSAFRDVLLRLADGAEGSRRGRA